MRPKDNQCGITKQTHYNRANGISKPALNKNGKPVLTSVWIPTMEQIQEYNKDSFLKTRKLTGRTFPHVIENLVLLYTDEGDKVYDPMLGTGTTLYVANKLNREVQGSDLNSIAISSFNERWKKYVGSTVPQVTQNTASELPIEDSSVDLLIMSFPWYDGWKFAEDREAESMDNNRTFEDFLTQSKLIYKECARVVKSGGYVCNILGNSYKKHEFYPVCMSMPSIIQEVGLKLHFQFWNLRMDIDTLKTPWVRSGMDYGVRKADYGHGWEVHEDIIVAKKI